MLKCATPTAPPKTKYTDISTEYRLRDVQQNTPHTANMAVDHAHIQFSDGKCGEAGGASGAVHSCTAPPPRRQPAGAMGPGSRPQKLDFACKMKTATAE